jgi:hypothetical protein
MNKTKSKEVEKIREVLDLFIVLWRSMLTCMHFTYPNDSDRCNKKDAPLECHVCKKIREYRNEYGDKED